MRSRLYEGQGFMTLQIAVVDDLEKDRRELRRMLEVWILVHWKDIRADFAEFSSARAFLLQGGLSGQYNVVFLDICMEGQNGLEAASQLRKVRVASTIIFVTSEKDYALQAYAVHPFDFLVKPFDETEIDRLLKDLAQEYVQEEKTLEIKVPFGTVHVQVSRIISVVSRGHMVDFKMENGNVVSSSQTFSEIVKMFQPYKSFLNINRGVLINMERALFLKDWCIVMSDRQPYPLRVREQASLIRIFTQYQIKHRMKGN